MVKIKPLFISEDYNSDGKFTPPNPYGHEVSVGKETEGGDDIDMQRDLQADIGAQPIKAFPMDEEIGDITRVLRNNNQTVDAFARNIATKLGYSKLDAIGEGTQGFAFDVGNSTILKITSDRSEAVEALKLAGKNNQHIGNFYKVYSFDEPYDNIYAITREKLYVDPDRVDTMYRNFRNYMEKFNIRMGDIIRCVKHKDANEFHNIENVLKNVETQNPPFKDSIIQFGGVIRELFQNDIRSVDFGEDNFGFKSNGNLAFYDIGYSASNKFDNFDVLKLENELLERVMSYMPNSTSVSVKKKCQLGGNGDGTSTACNQGDISNLDLGKISESITAYHGTPNKFDRFSIDKIGSSDGREVGGWGIYFTNDFGVANDYSNNQGGVMEVSLSDGNYLNLNDTVDDNLANYIISRGLRKGLSQQDIQQFESDFYDEQYRYNVTNAQVYEWLSAVLGGNRQASMFLKDAGYIGNVVSDRVNPDATNYIVFDPRNIRIVKNIDQDEEPLNEERKSFTVLYHGTSHQGAEHIKKYGVRISKSDGGYFGWGFYTTPDLNLAKENYADFAEDDNDKGVILEFRLSPAANILDLDDAADFETWKPYSKSIYDPNLYKLLIKNGIDGLHDNSFGGVVIYNPKVLTFVKEIEANSMEHTRLHENHETKNLTNITLNADFKKWFGNSEMVDKNNEPIIFYHGSKTSFAKFDKNKIGSATDAGWLGEGFYFYTHEYEAQQYGKVSRFYLKITNPYYATNEDNERLADANSTEASRDFTESLKAEGYDGVFYDGNLRGETVIFDADQAWKIDDSYFMQEMLNEQEIRRLIKETQPKDFSENSNVDLAYRKWKRDNVTYRGISDTAGQSGDNGGMAMLGQGLYSVPASNKTMARKYGKLRILVNAKPKNPKIFNTLNEWEIWFQQNVVFPISKAKGKTYPDGRDVNSITDEMLKRGYDGIIIKGREIVNYKPENVRYYENERQLEMYYDDFVRNNNLNEENDEKIKSPEWIYNYVNSLHRKGWEKSSFDDKEWIMSDAYYQLERISLNDPKVKWNFKPAIYSKLTTEIPPIVISSNGYIIDGMHRAGTAKILGLKEIDAYIGKKNSLDEQLKKIIDEVMVNDFSYIPENVDATLNDMKNHKIGDVISGEKLYNYVNALHDNDMDNDFIKDHILKYQNFKLTNLNSNDVDLIGSVDPTLVNDYANQYKNTKWYPPIVFDKSENMVIDGYHRAEAIKKLGIGKIMAWVGIENNDLHEAIINEVIDNVFSYISENKEISVNTLPFKTDIEQSGGKIYSVGGAVRDHILQRPSKDLDLLITGLPLDKLEAILSKYGKVDNVGKSFGIIKFNTPQTGELDIAIPRTERATGQGGYQGFDVTSDHNLPIEKDLERRDFTINAIAKDSAGNMIDPYHGQEDLNNKLIRMVNPQAFKDDPLRMIRAVQFAARFGFTIEPKTMEAIQQNADRIREISPERILIEFDKIVKKGNPVIGAQLLVETELYGWIFENSTNEDVNINYEELKKVKTMGEFIFILGYGNVPYDSVSEFYKDKLKGDLDTYNEIRAYEAAYNTGGYSTGIHVKLAIFNMFKLYPKSLESGILPHFVKENINQMRKAGMPFSMRDLQINGNDLLALGYTGQQIGKLLKDLILDIYGGKLSNNRDLLLRHLTPKEPTELKNELA